MIPSQRIMGFAIITHLIKAKGDQIIEKGRQNWLIIIILIQGFIIAFFLGAGIERYALAIVAESKLGEMLAAIEFSKGGRGKTGSSGGTTLNDIGLGITKKLSHEAQTIAENPEAEILLQAESRLGEMLAGRGSPKRTSDNKLLNGRETLPDGITKKMSHEAQTIAENPEKVEQIIAEAKEEEKIPIWGKNPL